MVPTLTATLGVKGHRPQVPTRDCKDLLYVLGSVNLITAKVHSNTLESPNNARKRTAAGARPAACKKPLRLTCVTWPGRDRPRTTRGWWW